MARSFNGSSDLVNCGNIAGINGASKATLAAWIYRASTGVTCSGGFTAGNATHTNGGDRFSFIWFTDGNIYFACENGAQQFSDCALSGIGWHHVAMVYDGTKAGNSTRFLAYIDGALQSLSFNGTSIPSALGTVNPLTWGKDSSDRFGAGVMADGAVWVGQVLSPGQIAALSKGVRPHKIGGYSAYTPLDGLASPEPDFSGNQNNGTLTGTALAAGPPVTLFTPRLILFPVTAAAAATAYTFTGPNSGVVGVTTSNYTVQSNGLLGSSVTITPADASHGGTFAPSTVTLGAGTNTSATFTYTPANAGTYNLSTTNSSTLTDPSPISFTASASSSIAARRTLSSLGTRAGSRQRQAA